jgi:DNA-binding NtrC family response regulator
MNLSLKASYDDIRLLLEDGFPLAIFLSEQPVISAEDVCLPRQGKSIAVSVTEEMSFKAQKQRAVSEFEIRYIRRVLAINQGNISKAARTAKKDRRSFWQLMRKNDITSETCSSWPILQKFHVAIISLFVTPR